MCEVSIALLHRCLANRARHALELAEFLRNHAKSLFDFVAHALQWASQNLVTTRLTSSAVLM